MTARDVRARVDALLAEVHIPTPFNAREFCRVLGAQRGRPIHLKAVDTAAVGLPSGTTYGLEEVDVILYDETTTGYHQDVIILHEAGHLIAKHPPGGLLSEDAAEFLLPEIGRQQVRRLAAREVYSTEEEQEAEYFARRVLERVSSRAGRSDGEPGRVEDTFEQ